MGEEGELRRGRKGRGSMTREFQEGERINTFFFWKVLKWRKRTGEIEEDRDLLGEKG